VFFLILGTEIDEQFVEGGAAGLCPSLPLIGFADQGTDVHGAGTGHKDGNKIERIAYLSEQRKPIAARSIAGQVAFEFGDARPISSDPHAQLGLAQAASSPSFAQLRAENIKNRVCHAGYRFFRVDVRDSAMATSEGRQAEFRLF
jgi:hypothetical protein